MHSLDRAPQRAHKVTPQIDVSKKMGPACSGNVISLVLAIGFAALVAASVATSQGNVFYVGDKDGWVSKPAESYDRWAARHSFTVSDTLVFKYKKGMDSLLVVDKRHYDACDGTDPRDELHDGNSTYVLGKTGPFYFISGDAGRCKKGQKLMVVVTAKMEEPPRGSRAPSMSPVISPFNSTATSLNYSTAQSPLASSPTFEGPSSSPKPLPSSFSPLPLSHAPSVTPKPKFPILAPTRSPSSFIPPTPPHKPQKPSVALAPTPSSIHLPSLAPKPHTAIVPPTHSPLSSSIPPSSTPIPQNPRIPIAPASSRINPPSSLPKQKSLTLAPMHSPSSPTPPSTPPKSQPPSMALEPALSHTHPPSPSPSPKSQSPMVAPTHPFSHSHPSSPHAKPQQPKVPTNRSPFSLPLSPAPEPQTPRIAPATVMPYTIPPSSSPKSQLEPSRTPLPSHTNSKASPTSNPSFPSSSSSSHVSPSLSPHRSKDSPQSKHAHPPSLPHISPSPSSSISKTYPMHMPSQSPMHLRHPPSLSPSMLLESPSPQLSLAPSPQSTKHPYIFGPTADSPTSLLPDQQLPPFLVPTIAPRPSHGHHVSAPSMHTSMSILVSTLLVVVLTFICI